MSPPRHLAIIPDGNRRWAHARGLSSARGHRRGIEVVGEVASAAWAAGVEAVTFWWGSPANLTRRAPAEVAAIIATLDAWLKGDGARRITAAAARFEAHGRWRSICPEIAAGIASASSSSGAGPRRLTLLMAYDGRDEIRAAAAALGGAGASAVDFGAALWTGGLPPVDLVLRTGGQPHLSAGFLLWQIAEAQLYFSPLMWPDFDAAALHEALAVYAATERRLGQ